MQKKKNKKKNDLVDAFAYGGCVRRSSGSQNRAVVPKRRDSNSFSSQLTKNKGSTKVSFALFNA